MSEKPLQRISVRLGQLELDQRNPRLSPEVQGASEREIIESMIGTSKILPLAASIADRGLYLHDSMIVIEKRSKTTGENKSGRKKSKSKFKPKPSYTVVEGNRRLAAIKLLITPDLAPIKHRRALKRLHDRADLTALKSISVVVAPDRESVLPLLVDRHTTSPIEAWPSLAQARFFRGMVEEDNLSVEEIAEQSASKSPGEIYLLLRTLALYESYAHLELEEETEKKVASPRFPMSILSRIIESPAGRKALGVDIADDQSLVGTVHLDAFTARMTTLFELITTDDPDKRVDTRKLNKPTAIKSWIDKEFIPAVPRTRRKRGGFRFDELGKPQAPDHSLEAPETAKPEPKPGPGRSVIPNDFRPKITTARIKTVFDELSTTQIKSRPNTSAILLRTLLDMGVYDYFKRDEHLPEMLASSKSMREKSQRADWSPSLKQMLQYGLDNKLFDGLDPQAYSVIRHMLKEKAAISIDSLDKWVHNIYRLPTEDELRSSWVQLEPLLKIVLE